MCSQCWNDCFKGAVKKSEFTLNFLASAFSVTASTLGGLSNKAASAVNYVATGVLQLQYMASNYNVRQEIGQLENDYSVARNRLELLQGNMTAEEKQEFANLALAQRTGFCQELGLHTTWSTTIKSTGIFLFGYCLCSNSFWNCL